MTVLGGSPPSAADISVNNNVRIIELYISIKKNLKNTGILDKNKVIEIESKDFLSREIQ